MQAEAMSAANSFPSMDKESKLLLSGPACSRLKRIRGRRSRRTSLQCARGHWYVIPPKLELNHWALQGNWSTGQQAVVLNEANGRIAYRFHARDLHLVMTPPPSGHSVRFRVFIDRQAPGAAHGVDVDSEGHGTLSEPRLYQLIRQPTPITGRQFEIEFLDVGAQAFDFTFG